MGTHSKFWLVVEVAICFLPLALGWIILLLLIPLQVEVLRELQPEQWIGPALVLYLVISGPVGMVAMYAMLVYLLRDGRRVLSNRAMITCIAVGVVTLSLAIIPPWEIPLLGMIYLLPLLCALHVLYLGRSYFSANKTMEPTR